MTQQLSRDQIVEAVMDAQAELQTPLGFYRMMDPKWEHRSPLKYDAVIEDRLTKTLARLHALLDALGSPMYQPASHPDVPSLTGERPAPALDDHGTPAERHKQEPNGDA